MASNPWWPSSSDDEEEMFFANAVLRAGQILIEEEEEDEEEEEEIGENVITTRIRINRDFTHANLQQDLVEHIWNNVNIVEGDGAEDEDEDE
ncbi:hypothetical protein Hdeb2414_s0386g00882671 [Helianthus debilis subsp. tardiflorus]